MLVVHWEYVLNPFYNPYLPFALVFAGAWLWDKFKQRRKNRQ